MPDIGWSEMAVIAILALLVIGPKDLPRVMKTVGQWVRKARSVTREFQSSVDEMIREADLEDARKAVRSAKTMNPEKLLSDTVDPTGTMAEEMRDLEREASRAAADQSPAAVEKPAASDVEAEADGDATKAAAVETPMKMAPPRSVTPPPAGEPSGTGGDSGADADVKQKSA